MADQKKISIVGAGLVGSVLASLLAQKGHKVLMFERRPDMRRHDIGGGRSINLALSDRGWKALDMIGISKKVREAAIAMKGRMIHNEDGSQVFQPYGKENQAIYSVSRGGLNQILMDHAEENGVKIFFDKRCEEILFDKTAIRFEDDIIKGNDLIFGADGAFSRVRLSMQMTDRFDYQQFYLPHGYKELTIPAGENGEHQLEKNALHIWPRHSFMLIALPNTDGSFTCTLFAPFEGENSFATINDKEDLKKYFERHFNDAIPLMPTLEEDFFQNPTSSLVTIKCFPWTHENVALIGDASHGIVPFYGQGMNSGFEDCTVLNEIIENSNGDWVDILKDFEESRKPNTDAIAELAIQNFIEMRDLVADPDFLLRKKIEKKMAERLPEQFLPLYSMVTFSDIPYSEALKMGKKQDAFFEEISKQGLLNENLNEEDLNKLTDIWLIRYAGK